MPFLRGEVSELVNAKGVGQVLGVHMVDVVNIGLEHVVASPEGIMRVSLVELLHEVGEERLVLIFIESLLRGNAHKECGYERVDHNYTGV